MASAQSRSGTRGRPPPKRWVFTCTGSSGCNCAHNSSEMRNPVVVPLFGVRSRSRFLVSCLFIPPILLRFRVIRIGSKSVVSIAGIIAELCNRLQSFQDGTFSDFLLREDSAQLWRICAVFFLFFLHLQGRACVGGFSLTLYRIVLPTLASIPIGLLRRAVDMLGMVHMHVTVPHHQQGPALLNVDDRIGESYPVRCLRPRVL